MDNKQNVYRKIIELAIGILENKIGVIEGSRELVNINAFYVKDKDHLFNIFRVIDSDTMDYPLGEIRQHWSQKSLEELDRKMAHYMNDIKMNVEEACKKLIEEFT